MKGDKILVMATKSESGSVLGSLSNSVFERRTSTGSGLVSFKAYKKGEGLTSLRLTCVAQTEVRGTDH